MRDQEIRAALHETELKKFYENGDLILDELGVCSGASRVDVAVINGALHGYEIKSDQDTLDRLPQQILSYSRVLDRVTLVACDNHLNVALNMIPAWWGVIVPVEKNGNVKLKKIRRGKINPSPDKISLCRMLWKHELIGILETKTCERGLVRKTRESLCHLLASLCTQRDINKIVREALTARGDWRKISHFGKTRPQVSAEDVRSFFSMLL